MQAIVVSLEGYSSQIIREENPSKDTISANKNDT